MSTRLNIYSGLILLSFLLPRLVWAQEKKADQEYTLQECIEYALQHNDSIKNAGLDVQSAKAKVGEFRSDGLPQLTGQVQLSKNYLVPQQLIPSQFFNPEARAGEFTPVQFSPDYQGIASASLEQLIFDGAFFVGLKAANNFKELSAKDLIRTKIDVAEAVSKAYYMALVNKERAELTEKNYNRLDTLHRETRIMFENGFAEKIDVDRITVQLNNIKVERNKIKRALELSYYLLKFQMGMSIGQPLQLASNIEGVDIAYDQLTNHDFAYSDRVEYSLLQTNKELAKLNMKVNQVQYIPKLEAFADIGATMGSSSSSDVFDFQNSWFETGAVGLRLSIPIFDGLRKSYIHQQNRIEVQKLENSFSNLENSIDLDIAQAKINLKNSIETMEAQKQNRELAEEVFRVTKIKYQEGVGSNFEVVEADTDLKEAETNYYDALINALITKVELEKALGTLLNN